MGVRRLVDFFGGVVGGGEGTLTFVLTRAGNDEAGRGTKSKRCWDLSFIVFFARHCSNSWRAGKFRGGGKHTGYTCLGVSSSAESGWVPVLSSYVVDVFVVFQSVFFAFLFYFYIYVSTGTRGGGGSCVGFTVLKNIGLFCDGGGQGFGNDWDVYVGVYNLRVLPPTPYQSPSRLRVMFACIFLLFRMATLLLPLRFLWARRRKTGVVIPFFRQRGENADFGIARGGR